MNPQNAGRIICSAIFFGLAMLVLFQAADCSVMALSGSIHQAAASGELGRVDDLLQRGVDVNTRDDCGFTALHLAARHGRLAVAKLLIDENAEIDAMDNGWWTPLHDAVQAGREPMVELLIAAGANVNAENLLGETPLHDAAENGSRRLTELLIAGGAEVNAAEDSGWTPLDLALYFENPETGRVLAGTGAVCRVMSGDAGKDEGHGELTAWVTPVTGH